MGGFCPLEELPREGSAPAACAAGLFPKLLMQSVLLIDDVLHFFVVFQFTTDLLCLAQANFLPFVDNKFCLPVIPCLDSLYVGLTQFSHCRLLNIKILKFNSLVLVTLLGNIFPYWHYGNTIASCRSNTESQLSSIDLQGRSVCIATQVRKPVEVQPELSGNTSGHAIGISLGLRLYFIVYPSSPHNTDSIQNQSHSLVVLLSITFLSISIYLQV